MAGVTCCSEHVRLGFLRNWCRNHSMSLRRKDAAEPPHGGNIQQGPLANSNCAILSCGTIQDTPHHGDEVALSAITALITIITAISTRVGDEVRATIQLS